MFGLGIGELLVIFIIALVVFGPRKLPEIGRAVGRAMMEFKKASQEFQESMREEMKEVEKTAQLDEIKKLGNIQLPDYGEYTSAKAPETQGEGHKADHETEEHNHEEIKGNG